MLTEEEILSPPLKENQTKELKAKNCKGTGETTAAFLNTDGGYLIFGISDGGEPVDPNTFSLKKIHDDVQRQITSTVSPDPFRMNLIEIFSNPFRELNLLVVKVSKSPEIHLHKGVIQFRNSGSNKKVGNKAEVMRILSKEIDEETYWNLLAPKLENLRGEVKTLQKSISTMLNGNITENTKVSSPDYLFFENALPSIQYRLKKEGIFEEYLRIIELIKRINTDTTTILNNFDTFFIKNPRYIIRLRIDANLDALVTALNEGEISKLLKK